MKTYSKKYHLLANKYSILLIPVFVICFSSCNNGEEKSATKEKPKDVFNKENYEALPHDSLRTVIDELRKYSFVGKPLREILMKWNPGKYKVTNVSYTNTEPQYYCGISFVTSSGFEINLIFADDNRINSTNDNRPELNMLNAKEAEDQIIKYYEINYHEFYVGLTLREASEKNACILLKNE